MVSTATPRVPLGASTTNRKWYVDVDTSTTGSPTWVPVGGITDFQPKRDGQMQDTADFDSGGFGNTTKTGENWSCSIKLRRGVTTASALAYDPGQETLRSHSQGTFGVANSVKVRYYEMEPSGPRIEAFQGRAAVSWTDDGGNSNALSTVSVELMGQGVLQAITHPDAP